MDVRMLDGTIISNVPDGITQEDLLARFGKYNDLKKPVANQNKSTAGDLLTAVKQGVAQIPGTIAGLADIPLELATGKNYISEAGNKLADITGIHPAEYAKGLEAEKSAKYQAAQAEVNALWEANKQGADNYGEIAKFYASHPALTATNVAESAPSMLLGGVGARALKGVEALSKGIAGASARGAIGEGAVSAGQINQQLGDEGGGSRQKALAATLAGVGTGAIAGASGKLATRLGIIDPETFLAGRASNLSQAELNQFAKAADRGIASRLGLGVLQEGILQELPQSVQEQMFQNWGGGKPIMEGVARNAIEGALAGSVMGGGFNALGGNPAKEQLQAQQEQQAAVAQAAAQQAQNQATGVMEQQPLAMGEAPRAEGPIRPTQGPLAAVPEPTTTPPTFGFGAEGEFNNVPAPEVAPGQEDLFTGKGKPSPAALASVEAARIQGLPAQIAELAATPEGRAELSSNRKMYFPDLTTKERNAKIVEIQRAGVAPVVEGTLTPELLKSFGIKSGPNYNALVGGNLASPSTYNLLTTAAASNTNFGVNANRILEAFPQYNPNAVQPDLLGVPNAPQAQATEAPAPSQPDLFGVPEDNIQPPANEPPVEPSVAEPIQPDETPIESTPEPVGGGVGLSGQPVTGGTGQPTTSVPAQPSALAKQAAAALKKEPVATAWGYMSDTPFAKLSKIAKDKVKDAHAQGYLNQELADEIDRIEAGNARADAAARLNIPEPLLDEAPSQQAATPEAQPVQGLAAEAAAMPDIEQPELTDENNQIERGLRGKSVKQVAEWLAENAPSKSHRVIANILAKRFAAFEKAGVSYGFNITSRLKGNTKGQCHTSLNSLTGHIEIKVSIQDSTGGKKFDVVLHELLHAGVDTAIASVQIARKNNRPAPSYAKFVDQISAVSRETKKVIRARVANGTATEFERRSLEGNNNAFANEFEFVAWGLSDTKMQTALDSIPMGQGKTLWSEFVNVIRELLGIPATANSALSEILAASEELLSVPHADIKGALAHRSNMNDELGREESLNDLHALAQESYDEFTSPDEAYDAMYENAGPKGKSVLRALKRDQFLGYDYPHQAIEAILQEPESADLSPSTKAALSKMGNTYWGQITSHQINPAAQAQAQQSINNMAGMFTNGTPTTTPTTTQIAANIGQQIMQNPVGALGMMERKVNAFRNKVVWRGATLADDIQRQNDNAFRDAYGNVRADLLLSQAENTQNITEAVYTYGGIEVTADGSVSAKVDAHSIDGVFRHAKQLAEKIGPEMARDLITKSFYAWRAQALVNRPQDEWPINWQQDPRLVPTPQQIQAGLAAFAQFPELRGMRTEFIGSKNQAVKFLYQAGFLTKSKLDAFLADDSYAPWFRLKEYDVALPGLGNMGRMIDLQQMQALKGGSEQVNDMLENMAQVISWMVRSGVANHSANQALKAMTDMGTATQHQMVPAGTNPDNVVMTYIDGKRAFWSVSDPLQLQAFQSVKGMNSPAIKVMNKWLGRLRAGIVLFPAFPIRQVVMDTYRAYTESGVKHPAKMAGKVFMTFLSGEAYRAQHPDIVAMKMAGVIGAADFNLNDSTRGRAEAYGLTGPEKGITALWLRNPAYKALHHFAYSADLSVRLGIYRQTMEETGDKELAIARAREIINFQKSGTSELMITLKHMIPFLGAYLQGTDVNYRSMIGRGNSMQTRKAAAAAFWGNMATLAALSVAYTMCMSGDDDYEDQKGFITDRNFIIPGTKMMLPVPTDIGFIAKVIPERITDYIMQHGTDDPESLARLVDGIRSASAAAYMPPAAVYGVTPAIEIMLNKSFFTDIPIVGQHLQQLEPFQQYSSHTSEFAKSVGAFANMSPMKIDYLMNAIGGTSAGAMLQMMDSIMTDNRIAPEKPQLLGTSVLNSFIAKEVGGRYSEEFYASRELANKTYQTVKAMSDAGETEKLDKYLERPEVKARMDAYPALEQMNAMMQDVRTTRAGIENDPDLSPTEKRAQVTELLASVEKAIKESQIRKLRTELE